MTKIRIVAMETADVRFPTSLEGDGSDALHHDPDYSAAYVILKTNVGGLEGHGLAFTLGRGNELCVQACESLRRLVVGRKLADITESFGDYWSELANDSQLRWVGPEKGVLHLAMAAIVNALWDLWAKSEAKPLWRLVVDLSPEHFVRSIDFRYIRDALEPDEAVDLLRRQLSAKSERIADLEARGYPTYVTSAGWLGYPEAKLRQRCRAALSAGWNAFKIKVGRDPAENTRRVAIMRDEIGPQCQLMLDANQCWEVDEAIDNMHALAQFNPLWIEEPTSPDDILGHARIARAIEPIGVATGEQCQNRVVFKQLLQANAIAFCQVDACRLGGLNEVLAVMLLAHKFGVPVCPHAGGVGLCQHVNHLVMIDYVAISATLEGRLAEYVGHLHEHFVNPGVLRRCAYVLPTAPGYGVTMHAASRARYRFPDGPVWRERLEQQKGQR